MVKLLYKLQPDEIYNLGAQSHVSAEHEKAVAALKTPFATIA